MTRNSYFIPALMGIFTGLVFFGVQISLEAMNSMVRPDNPYTMCSVCRVERDKWHFIVLEKSFYITLPASVLPPAAEKGAGESTVFMHAARKAFNNAWENLLQAAGEYYNRGYEFLGEFSWRREPPCFAGHTF